LNEVRRRTVNSMKVCVGTEPLFVAGKQSFASVAPVMRCVRLGTLLGKNDENISLAQFTSTYLVHT
jgi:hypothetical protein